MITLQPTSKDGLQFITIGTDTTIYFSDRYPIAYRHKGQLVTCENATNDNKIEDHLGAVGGHEPEHRVIKQAFDWLVDQAIKHSGLQG